MSVPELEQTERTPRVQRPTVFAIAIGGGVCAFATIVGLIILGLDDNRDVAVTGLAAIGSTLAGGFAGWIGRSNNATRTPNERATDRQP